MRVPILAPATLNDMNSLDESGDDYSKFVIFTPEERSRNSILSSNHLCMSLDNSIYPFWQLKEQIENGELYENCKIFHTFKFLLDSNMQIVIKSDIHDTSWSRLCGPNPFFKTPFVGVVFDEDSSIHFIPFKCFCPRRRLIAKRAGYAISDNAPSVFLGNITNEQIFLSFQKMKYQKFVLNSWVKEDKNFKKGYYYLSIYKYY